MRPCLNMSETNAWVLVGFLSEKLMIYSGLHAATFTNSDAAPRVGTALVTGRCGESFWSYGSDGSCLGAHVSRHQSSHKGSYVSKSCLNRQLVMAKLSYHKPNGFINANILAAQHFLQRASIHVMCALHCVWIHVWLLLCFCPTGTFLPTFFSSLTSTLFFWPLLNLQQLM